MKIDITAAAFATTFLFVAGHIIIYFVRQGEFNQWKKSIDENIKEMEASIKGISDIHTLEKLNAQKLNKLVDDFKEHKATTEGQFERLGNKIDTSFNEILKAVINR